MQQILVLTLLGAVCFLVNLKAGSWWLSVLTLAAGVASLGLALYLTVVWVGLL